MYRWLGRFINLLGSNHDALMVVFTLLIFIATGTYAVVAILQWNKMDESNQINRAALVSVQRAFVGFSELSSIPTIRGKEKFIGVAVIWENVGTTPATGVVQNFAIKELSKEPDGFLFMGSDNAVFHKIHVGPKARDISGTLYRPLDFYMGKCVPGPAICPDSDRQVYSWGWVVYQDTFPRTPAHLTEFCRLLVSIFSHRADRPQGISERSGYSPAFVPTLNWVSCDSHNCVDKDCPDYEEILAYANRHTKTPGQ